MQPHQYQADFIDAIESAYADGATRQLIVMATGLGKTVTSAFLIRSFFARGAAGRTLFLCHENEILRQARATYERVLGPERTYGFFCGTEKDYRPTDVLFASFQTMQHQRAHFSRDEFRYVVIDEAHHITAPTYRPTAEYFRPDLMLGMTATPDRTEGAPITDVLGPPVKSLDLPKAAAHRYLCEVDYRLMTDEIIDTGFLDTSAGKLTFNALNRTIFAPRRDTEIAEIIEKKLADIDNPRVIVFCNSIRHAGRMSQVLPGAVLHSNIPRHRHRKILDDFRAGKTNTVFAVNMLNEGVDVPDVNVVVFLRSTDSPTVYLQQLGRGLRQAEGKHEVLVLDFVANCERITMIDDFIRAVHDEHAQLTTGLDDTDEPALDPGAPGELATGQRGRPPIVVRLDGDPQFAERRLELIDAVRNLSRGYTKQELTDLLTRKIKELGKVPSHKEVRRDQRMPSIAEFERVFGMPWPGIIQSLGEKPLHRTYRKDELARILKTKARTLGRAPTKTEVEKDPSLPSTQTFSSAFGMPWLDILESLGILVARREQHTSQSISKALRAKAEHLGHAPTMMEIGSDPDLPSLNTIRKITGKSYSELLSSLGLEDRRKPHYTEADLRALLETKVKELGRPPTGKEIDDDPRMPSTATFRKIFGKRFLEILTDLGYISEPPTKRRSPPGPPPRYSRDELLSELAAKTREIGRAPTRREVARDPNMHSVFTYLRRMNTNHWADVIAALTDWSAAPAEPPDHPTFEDPPDEPVDRCRVPGQHS